MDTKACSSRKEKIKFSGSQYAKKSTLQCGSTVWCTSKPNTVNQCDSGKYEKTYIIVWMQEKVEERSDLPVIWLIQRLSI